MRSAGIKYLYRRGKIYYYVRHSKWTSLHTADRREARRRLARLLEQAVTTKFLNESGLGHLLRAFAQNPQAAQHGTQPAFLAPNFANVDRPQFAAFTEAFLARLTGPESQTPRMWKTCNNSLLELLQTLPEFGKEDLRDLDLWAKFLTLTPSGVWKALQRQKKGPSSLNHFASYLRKLVPKMVELGFAPAWFATDAKRIKKLDVKARDPHIPSPAEMELLLRKCEECDWELAQLPRALVYSGARRGAFLHTETGLRWPQIDFEHRDIIFTQKGSKRARVPMGPQLHQLLKRWQQHTGGNGDSLVFPFGSSKQDRIQAILKKVCGFGEADRRSRSHDRRAMRILIAVAKIMAEVELDSTTPGSASSSQSLAAKTKPATIPINVPRLPSIIPPETAQITGRNQRMYKFLPQLSASVTPRESLTVTMEVLSEKR